MDARNLVGTQIGNFEFRQILGEGAMGVVYLGIDIHLQRPVGIKMMHTHIARQPDFRERFRHEARAIAQLGHPHIINIHGFYEENDYLFFVMEYVPCGSLRGYLKERVTTGNLLSINEVITLVKQIASALDYAHLQNMIHRDVKPDNVLLRSVPNVNTGQLEFSAILSDFGLVKLAESAGFQSQAHSVVGTLPYMAPELFEGDEVDGRVDLYALGIMLYELAVGQLPFRPKSLADASRLHISSEPPLPRTIRNEIPREFEALITKSIEKEPDRRFQRGLEFIEALQEFQDEEIDIITEIDEPLSQQGRLDSLQTYIASMTPPAWGLTAVHRPDALDYDRIVISKGQGETIDFIPLTEISTSIGRDVSATIVLDSPKVSRIHAYITRTENGEYTIRDNNSTNGTYLGIAPLLSNVPEPWSMGQVVGIGPYFLQLQKAAESSHSGMKNKERDRTVVDTATHLHVREGVSLFTQTGEVPIEVQLDPGNILIEPGQQAGAQLQVLNRSHVVQHCRLRIEGIPVSWRTLPEYDLQLLPNERNVFPITFHPGQDWTSTAGAHRFTLYLQAVSPPQEMAYGTGTIVIQPFQKFAIDLLPERIRQSGSMTLTVTNQGNAVEQFTVQTRDREAALQFTPRETQIIVPPGQRGKVELQVAVREDFSLEGEEVFPFEIRVSSQQGMMQSKSGELVAKSQTPSSGTLMYTVLDPTGNRHHISLQTDKIALDLIRFLQLELNLDINRGYRLSNAKTGQDFLPGQTLEDIGIPEGGILWIQEDVTPEVSSSHQPSVMQTYSVIDPNDRRHTLTLRADTLVVDLLNKLPQELKLKRQPDATYYLCDGRTGEQLMPGQTLADAGMGDGGALWLRIREGEAAKPQLSQKYVYTFLTPNNKRRKLTLDPSLLVYDLLTDYTSRLKLKRKYRYFAYNGKTGAQMLPGQTLADAGLPEGGLIGIKLDPSSSAVKRHPGPLMWIISLPWLLLKLLFNMFFGVLEAVALFIDTMFKGVVWVVRVIIIMIVLVVATALFFYILAVLFNQ